VSAYAFEPSVAVDSHGTALAAPQARNGPTNIFFAQIGPG
jgi:hypothetical protein